MKLNINATIELSEVIDSYFRPKLEEQGVKDGNFIVKVQNKQGNWVDIDPNKVKIEFNK